jgi:hypothetical protein
MPIIIKNNDQKIIQLGSARWHWVCDRSDLFCILSILAKRYLLKKIQALIMDSVRGLSQKVIGQGLHLYIPIIQVLQLLN